MLWACVLIDRSGNNHLSSGSNVYLKSPQSRITIHKNQQHPRMRKTIPMMCLLAALTASTRAQTNVWHDDFDQFPVGANSDTNTYGAIAYNFTGAGIGHPLVMITNNLPDNLPGDPSYTHSNNCAFTVDTNPSDYS